MSAELDVVSRSTPTKNMYWAFCPKFLRVIAPTGTGTGVAEEVLKFVPCICWISCAISGDVGVNPPDPPPPKKF